MNCMIMRSELCLCPLTACDQLHLVSKRKDIETGLVPLSTSVMWVMAGGLGLLQATPGPVLGYRRFRREEGKTQAYLKTPL